MTTFQALRFPPHMSVRATGGPTFSTSLVETSGGFEQRNINWLSARMRYNLAPAVQNRNDLEFILSFFQTHKGKGIGFSFKDWTDFKVEKGLIGEGNSSQKVFDFCKRYGTSPNEYVRKLHKIIPETIKIFIDDVKSTPLIDIEKSQIIFEGAPILGSKITASFEFDVFVRFDTDELLINPDLDYITNLEIPIIEIKL